MTQKFIKTPSLSRIPTISGLAAENNSGGNLVNKTTTIPVYKKILINSRYLIANNIWRIISRKQSKEIDPLINHEDHNINIKVGKTIKPKAYEVEWGYFVDPSRLYNPDDRQRSYSSTSVTPFLKPIKEINSDFFDKSNYGLLYTICNTINKYTYEQFAQRAFIIFSITLLTTVSTYSLYKIH